MYGKLGFSRFDTEKAYVISKLGCFSEIIHEYNKNYYTYDTIEVYRVDDDAFGQNAI